MQKISIPKSHKTQKIYKKMRTVLQRVSRASVSIGGTIKGEIGSGILCLLGVHPEDTDADIEWLVKKIVNLRIFNDEDGVMNVSILDHGGNVLVVSQFTLYASTKKGNRPSYIKAAGPDIAIPLYERFVKTLSDALQRPVPTGEFGANMQVELVNDGPVTIIIDSKNRE